jgi:KDO2-lipid IV(A) lauroyltransferase
MIVRLVRSAAVLYLYFPHRTLLRLAGPRAALLLARPLAALHWVLALLGAERKLKRAMCMALARSQPGLPSLRTIWHYVLLRQQRFIEWHLCPTARGRRWVARTYRHVEGREHIDRALADGRGAIVLVFHFGLSKMVWPVLQELGYDNYHHVFRGETYAGRTSKWVARAAMRRMAASEGESGLKIIYHRPSFAFETMVRLLRRNQLVGINGDGMMGVEFVEVPFLDGRMAFPTGPARMAAYTGAPILPVFCLPSGLNDHRLFIHPPVLCPDDRPAALRECIEACVRLLEDYTRRHPWAWWTWRRLEVEQGTDGRAVLRARGLSTRNGWSCEVGGSSGRP